MNIFKLPNENSSKLDKISGLLQGAKVIKRVELSDLEYLDVISGNARVGKYQVDGEERIAKLYIKGTESDPLYVLNQYCAQKFCSILYPDFFDPPFELIVSEVNEPIGFTMPYYKGAFSAHNPGGEPVANAIKDLKSKGVIFDPYGFNFVKLPNGGVKIIDTELNLEREY